MRYMKPNKSARIPANHVFVDTETNAQSVGGDHNIHAHSLRMWCCKAVELVDSSISYSFYESGFDATSFWDMLYYQTSIRYVLWVWGHNMTFDFTQLRGWQELDEGRLLLERRHEVGAIPECGPRRVVVSKGTVILGDDVFLIKCMTRDGHRINFISSTNFFRCKLADMGRMVGTPKKDVDFANVPDSVLLEYCFNDVEILAEAVINYVNFIRENDFGLFRPTLGSQAMAAYRHRFMHHKILLHDVELVRRIETEAHMGGECRAFFLGKVGGPWDTVNTDNDMLMEEYKNVIISQVYELDVNSLYPSVMEHGLFPRELVGVVDYEGKDGWPGTIFPSCCIAAVKIYSKDHCYPIRYDGRTTYVKGKFWTTLCGPELLHAYKNGHIVNTGLICCYDIEPLFTDYIKHMWQMRLKFKEEGNTIYSEIVKILLVSIYGKWSQRKSNWRDCDDPEEWQPWGTWIVAGDDNRLPRRYRAVAGKTQIECKDDSPSGPFPAISAFTTSYGRMQMYQFRKIAGDRNVFYQGIDSLHVNRHGYDNLCKANCVSTTTLGALRLEGIHERAFYWGPMDYMIGEKLVRAGWKQRGKAEGVDSWRQIEFEGIDSILSQKPTGIIYQWDRVLRHGKPFIHGTVGTDGWLVPTTLNREEQVC